ncbi:hypothetical protein U1Q18_031582 [Sarracenia purpurea var. burkii]
MVAAATVTVAAAPPPPPRTVSPSNSGEEQVISSNSPPAAAPMLCPEMSFETTAELIEENERLKKENIQLNRELNRMKSLCGNIYTLMSSYANNRSENCSQAAVKPLDLLSARRSGEEHHVTAGGDNQSKPDDEIKQRLFGVAIGAKRERESGQQEEMQLQLQLGGNQMKSEPLDYRNSCDDQETTCLRRCNRTNQRAC